MDLLETGIALLAAWNLAVFALYGLDKHSSKRGGRRVRERTLLLAAAFMGAPGAFAAMRLLRHKTRHTAFKIGVPLLLILNLAVLSAIMLLSSSPAP